MVKYIRTLFVLAYLLVSCYAFAQKDSSEELSLFLSGIEPYEYKSADSRDPFMRLVDSTGRILIWKKETNVLDWSLEGIILDEQGGDSYAIINGEILREGESMDSFTVTRIEKNKAMIEKSGQIYTLELVVELPQEAEEEDAE